MMRLSLFAFRVAAPIGAILLAGCVGGATSRALPPLALPPALADTVHTRVVAPGARLHTLVNVTAPWRAYVLEVDLRCTRVQALKGSTTAVGRTTTSGLLAALPNSGGAVAAINADFFLFAPPGVPTNLHVERGVLVSGPGPKPVVLAANGRLHIDSIVATGTLTRGPDHLPLFAWNRPVPNRAGVVDARWGVPLDTVVRRQLWRLEPARATSAATPVAGAREAAPQVNARYVVRAAGEADTLAFGDTLLLHLPPTAVATAARASSGGSDRVSAPTVTLHAGDTVQLRLSLVTRRGDAVSLTDAVGGRPIVLADSVLTADVDREGNEGFRNLNPRSAVGVNRAGTRAWFAVIDGRQPGYSVGMTLREVGDLMRGLGATRALNLDGGGSSALAVRERATDAPRVVNRPSDKTERPVGNALGIFSTCQSR